MEYALLAIRLLLAGVFAVAGVAKLADRAGTRRAIAGFSVPDRLANPLSIILPLAELAIAAALLPSASAQFAAIAAVLLLIVFLVAIVFNLAAGHKPDCRCFGQLQSTPIGASTVALNLALLALAGLLVPYGTGLDLVAWLIEMTPIERAALAGWVIAGVSIAAIVVLAHRNRQLTLAVEKLQSLLDEGWELPPDEELGLPVGTKAPAFALPSLDGRTVALDDLLAARKPVVLVFSDPECKSCAALLPKLVRWQQEHADTIVIAVVSDGTPEDYRGKAGTHGPVPILLQTDDRIAEAYRSFVTPGAVIVQPDGTIGSLIVGAGGNDIEQLILSTAGAASKAPRLGATVFLAKRTGGS